MNPTIRALTDDERRPGHDGHRHAPHGEHYDEH